MSTSTETIPGPPPRAQSPTSVIDPHTELRRLTARFTELTAAHDTLRDGICRELTTLVARRWV